MEKVQITLQGKLALVDQDMVKKMLRKEALVNQALALKQVHFYSAADACAAAAVIAVKIIRLNRTIRQNVRFI